MLQVKILVVILSNCIKSNDKHGTWMNKQYQVLLFFFNLKITDYVKITNLFFNIRVLKILRH